MPTFPEETRSAVTTVNNTQVATFPAAMKSRMIKRISITGPADSVCVLYIGQMSDIGRRDASGVGQSDTAEYPNGLLVPGGSPVYLVWNRTDTQATATVQWA